MIKKTPLKVRSSSPALFGELGVGVISGFSVLIVSLLVRIAKGERKTMCLKSYPQAYAERGGAARGYDLF